ncbi:MAG: hypothetical protein ACLTYN_02825 [Dysosmobacter welbionis]
MEEGKLSASHARALLPSPRPRKTPLAP